MSKSSTKPKPNSVHALVGHAIKQGENMKQPIANIETLLEDGVHYIDIDGITGRKERSE